MNEITSSGTSQHPHYDVIECVVQLESTQRRPRHLARCSILHPGHSTQRSLHTGSCRTGSVNTGLLHGGEVRRSFLLFYTDVRVNIDGFIMGFQRQGRVPPEKGANLAYFSDEAGSCCQCADWLQWKCCPCCVATKDYRFTKQGLGERINPPAISICCSTITNRFHNLSFMKDVDWSVPLHAGRSTGRFTQDAPRRLADICIY